MAGIYFVLFITFMVETQNQLNRSNPCQTIFISCAAITLPRQSTKTRQIEVVVQCDRICCYNEEAINALICRSLRQQQPK